VQAAGAVSLLPLGGQNASGTITVASHAVAPEDLEPEADQRAVTTDYFRAMGIALVRGRFFDQRDSDTAPPVAIVDETLAKIYWPHEDAVGQRLHFGEGKSPSPWMTVVGVVRHVRNRTLEARSRVEMYWPEAQNPMSAMTLTVLTAGNPADLAPAVQREVAAIDPDLPVYRFRTMTEVMGESVARRRLALILIGVFAGLALVLAAVGIYGVTSYVVGQSQQEIGLRMALGAGRGQVLRMMMRRGMGTITAGLVIGLVAALLLTRLLGGMLFDVRPADPLTLGSASVLLLLVASLAIFIPARRAAHVDPMVALRCE
jgi:predicted permease